MILPAAFLAARASAAKTKEGGEPLKVSELKAILDDPNNPRHQDLLDLIQNAKTAPDRDEHLGQVRTDTPARSR